MKTKFNLLISLILIALVAITTYTPQAAQAEVQTQEDPVSEAGEGPSRPDADNQINANEYDYFNAVGINFVPHDSDLTYYNGLNGCLGSYYVGGVNKVFSITVNVPDNVKGNFIYLTYNNTVEDPSGSVYVVLWRRFYNSPDTQKVKQIELTQSGEGWHNESFQINDVTFNTNYWLYWLEIYLPPEGATREFCGVQISYIKPPIFPVALPMIQR